MNEICHGPDAIEESEFDSRIGASRQDAETLLDGLGQLLSRESRSLRECSGKTPDPDRLSRLQATERRTIALLASFSGRECRPSQQRDGRLAPSVLG